ncbi:hypothetical protein NUW58_g1807 [Xylaria curta]|uniref:Uncharacterized protein n=1 Tax=Xylaria curta TaxID=42375 RepID=A0ACC1PJQ0_9PEZI|nr:hypothetical protein NUW58_g1807 [Xylaria curta]
MRAINAVLCSTRLSFCVYTSAVACSVHYRVQHTPGKEDKEGDVSREVAAQPTLDEHHVPLGFLRYSPRALLLIPRVHLPLPARVAEDVMEYHATPFELARLQGLCRLEEVVALFHLVLYSRLANFAMYYSIPDDALIAAHQNGADPRRSVFVCQRIPEIMFGIEAGNQRKSSQASEAEDYWLDMLNADPP